MNGVWQFGGRGAREVVVICGVEGDTNLRGN